MKILLFGGTGNIGQRILNEALNRGHEVTSVQRKPELLKLKNANLTVVKGDLLNEVELPALIMGKDVIVSAISLYTGLTPEQFKKAHQNLINALKGQQQTRVIAVGGGTNNEIAPGVRMLDNADIMSKIPSEYYPPIFAHGEVQKFYENSGLKNWTYFNPAAMIQAGERTGKFRLGTTNLIADKKGESTISFEDYAVALVDEIENQQYLGQPFTIGY
ncbi:NAD(P)H-binding protein [Mucilaginibacter sp. cycad4]|uniref:NAD(P)-dependent oxidoreductase n=1 Tax=Mucilaginibacter sp. cycad4 TaxID=3342096 RepID=UPI002AAC2A2D|nr:NAD(P)H-binding protein [Mucilaginibacter gossypii]WPV01929.1 NAD(P)H-binding protein [Mucilaginibacter gossypii]